MPDLDLTALEPGSLMMFHDDEGDGVALAVSLREGMFCRARRGWQALPLSSTILDGISLRCVHPDFVALYDQLQDHGQMPSVAQTQEFEIDVKPGAKPTPAPIVLRPFGAAGPQEAAVRGMLLGLALGDAVGLLAGSPPARGLLPAGAATQLTLATADALVRAEVSSPALMTKEPIDTATREIVHAFRRWALRRGEVPASAAGDAGWTSQLAALRERRGSSPTTVQALLTNGSIDSDGYHALLRTAPIAAWNRAQELLVRASVESTHSAAKVDHVAQLWVTLLRRALDAPTLDLATTITRNELGARSKIARHLGMIEARAAGAPCDVAMLHHLAPRRSALSALTGGLYVALSYPDADTVGEALAFAAQAAHGNAVAAVAGAALGATHGVHALPTSLVSRLELGWAMDTLARDLTFVGRAGVVREIQTTASPEADRLRRAYPAAGR